MPLPPPPTKAEAGSFAWDDWYNKLRNFITSANGIDWSSVNKAGSKLSDLAIRDHIMLTNVQGGSGSEQYHFLNSEHTTLQAWLGNQTANTVLSGPTSGGATNPTFRNLVQADLPDHGAWTVYSPVGTLGSGAFGNATLTGRWSQLGKRIFVQFDLNIIALGTAAGTLSISLPVQAAAFPFPATGRERGSTGKVLAGQIDASGTVVRSILFYDATSALATGNILNFTFTYESA